MNKMFFYGTLRDEELRSAVLGHSGKNLSVQPAVLLDYEVLHVPAFDIPYARQKTGAKATGVLVEGLSDTDLARLTYYEAGFDYQLHDLNIQTQAESLKLPVYVPPKSDWELGDVWQLEYWQRSNGGLNAQAALEIMESFGVQEASVVFRNYSSILFRALARLAGKDTDIPQTLHRKTVAEDVQISATRRPYGKYFAVEELDLKFRRYDETLSPIVERAVFVTGDAVTVLPYDPKNQLVMLVEQFRAGPVARCDPNPWTLEPIAGRRDPGETFEDTARREALEEANIEIKSLELIGNYYPSPGCFSEYLHSYCGICDLSKDIKGVHGLNSEDEDIRSLVVSLSDLMDAVQSGEINTAPLLVSALWLDRNKNRLRQVYGDA